MSAGGDKREGEAQGQSNLERGSSLHIASEKGHADVLELLIDHRADVEAVVAPGTDPRTPLHLAAEYAHEECVSLLLRRGADVRAELPLAFLQQVT